MAAEPKTKPTDASVADFIAAIDNPKRRADAELVDAMLTRISGEQPVMWGPTIIGYGRYGGATGDWPVVGFSPRKAQTVLYILGFPEQDALLAKLGKHKTGKACLYINRLEDVDMGVLHEMAERSVRHTRTRYPA